MASSYPSGLDAMPTNHTASESETGHPGVHNDLADAINKIEAELGLLPKGNFATVRARLDSPEWLMASRDGVLAVAAGTKRFYLPVAVTIVQVQISVGTAPTGANLIVDINKNGTTIFTTQSARPTITAGQFVSPQATPAVTAFASGDYLSLDVDQIGSTVAGSDLIANIQFRR